MKENPNTKPKLIKRIPNIPKKPQKGSKFNIFWVYAAIILGIFVLQFLFNADNSKLITYRTFESTMLKPGDVQKLVAYKHEDIVNVEVYIKPEKLKDPKYKEYQNKSNFGAGKGPVAYFKAGSMDAVDALLKESQKDIPPAEQVMAEPETRQSSFNSWFFTVIIPVLLFIGFWIFIMRRMGGGAGGGGGQIFNIGKSKATLFDKESQVNVTFNDVAIQLYNRDYGVPLDLVLEPGNEIYHHVPEHVNNKWFDYINEKGFFRDLPVIEGSVEALKKLQEKHDIYIVSAATEFRNSLEDKWDWLAEHFPFITWRNIMFCGDKIVNVDVMVDDRAKNFVGFSGRKLLFTSPHNLLLTEYERVDNWQQVLDKLL